MIILETIKYSVAYLSEWIQENIVIRRVLFVFCLCLTCISLFVGAYTSPKRQLYTSEQLMTKRSFTNGSGEIEIKSQQYSPETGIIVLELETSDTTSSVNRGIEPSRLEWKLYSPNPSNQTSMEVVPVTDSKISVIIRNVPDNFGVFAIDIKNTTVNLNQVNVDISSSSSEGKMTSKKNDNDDTVQFFVATQNDKLKKKYIKDVSREEFALGEIKSEMKYQEGQKARLENAIEQLKDSIEDDENTKVGYQEEAKYLSSEDLVSNQKNIDTLDTSIENKNEQIVTATENQAKIEERIKSLTRKKEAILSGTFEFSSSIKTIKMN